MIRSFESPRSGRGHAPGRGAYSAVGAAVAVLIGLASVQAMAAELNLYTSRHYQTDEALYSNFTEATGIEINRIEGKAGALFERLKSEGLNSPADVMLTVDAGMLWRMDQAGLFAPVESAELDAKVPENLRHPEGHWFGFSTRARVIYTAKGKVGDGEIKSYEDLADAKWKGRICIRSSSNIYNQSLLSSLIAANGEPGAEDWANAIVGNMARDPQGGDTDQIRAVAAGECDVAVGNSYYYLRLVKSDKPEDKAVVEKVSLIFPNQDGRGAHVNISGGAMLKNAPNKDAAVKFLEYLANESAQRYFADGNNEFPVVEGIKGNDVVQNLGDFKIDPINVAVYGENQPTAQKVMDRAGWK